MKTITITKADGSILKIKQIKGYPDYAITNEGDVLSFKGKKIAILKPMKKRQGYLSVNLCADGKSTEYYIHRIVLSHFKKFTAKNKLVNHKDGNKKNNHVDNLEASNHSLNRKHADSLKKAVRTPKVKMIMIHTKTGVIIEINSLREGANQLNVTYTAVYNVLNNKQKTVKNYTIEYDQAA